MPIEIMYALISAALLFNAPPLSATEKPSGEPTAENWREFSTQICDVDQKDSYGLKAVIFPPKYETYMEELESIPTLEYIMIPAYTKKDGTKVPARMQERLVPDMRHPKALRRPAPEQAVGFLNAEGVLVNISGQIISEHRPVDKFSTVAQTIFESGETSVVIWERDVHNDDTEARLTAKYENKIKNSKNCSYLLGNTDLSTIEYLERVSSGNGVYECRTDGGYQLKLFPPIDVVRKRTVVSRPDGGSYWLKDDKGKITRGITGNQPLHIYDVMEQNEACNWQRAF